MYVHSVVYMNAVCTCNCPCIENLTKRAHSLHLQSVDLNIITLFLYFSAGEGIKHSISMAKLIILAIVMVKSQHSDNTRRRRLQLYQRKFRHNTGHHCRDRSTYSVRASAVVTSLLLQSGDVEQNPGPGQQSCKLI